MNSRTKFLIALAFTALCDAKVHLDAQKKYKQALEQNEHLADQLGIVIAQRNYICDLMLDHNVGLSEYDLIMLSNLRV